MASGSPPMSTNRSTAATRSPSARAACRASATAFSDGGGSSTIVPPALRFIRPGISRCSPFASTASSDGSPFARRDRRKAAGAQGVVVGGQQFAQGVHAVAAHGGRMFARGIEHVVVEQENPVLGSLDDRLDQDRIVIFRDLVEIAGQRGLTVNGLREIAARSRQRFDEGRCAESSEIRRARRSRSCPAGRCAR